MSPSETGAIAQETLTRGRGLTQPAAGAYASGTPTPFISISQLRSNSSSNACLIQSEKVLNVNSSGRSRPPIEARARGFPVRIRLEQTRSGRLYPESSLPPVLGGTHDSWSQSPNVSGRAVRPVSACDQPDRMPHIHERPLRSCHDPGLIGDSDCKREFQFPLAVFVHPIGRHVRTVRV